MESPCVVVTGASGFIGRHLLDGLKKDFRIIALARRSQKRCGAPVHDNITWIQVDIRHKGLVSEAFDEVRRLGGADFVVHLAAHYDFTGENHPDYRRTNIDGLRHVLDQCRNLDLERFIFASSIAACDYPTEGTALDESSPPDGKHVYARSKAVGEAMLAEYDDTVPSCIARFAALFSDWCEYPPLYFFIESWLSRSWNRRVLGGRGSTAIPYLHVREIAPFIRAVFQSSDRLEQREVLLASPDMTMSHRELFRLVHHHTGRQPPPRPLCLPKALCAVGIPLRDFVGRVTGNRPFERPWMAAHIDRNLLANPHRTWERLRWHPRGRLQICRRLPFMFEHRSTDAVEWNRRNEAALKEPWVRPNLLVHRLVQRHMDAVRRQILNLFENPEKVSELRRYGEIPRDVLDWRVTVAYRHILNALRTNERGLFTDFCKDLAVKRHAQGFSAEEVCRGIRLIQDQIIRVIQTDPEAKALMPMLVQLLGTIIEFGCDQIIETYESLGAEVPDDYRCDDPFMRYAEHFDEEET